MRIALLEDDPDQAALLKQWLEGAGHACNAFASGKTYIKDIGRESYDLLILDWGVPDKSGLDVLGWIREHVEAPVPVMFVTARDQEADIVTALERGADDYLTKPIRKLELRARLNALQRRSRQDLANKPALEFEPFRIDTNERRVFRAGREVELTQKEYEVALFLFRNMGRLVSRGHILEMVWGRNPTINTRTVDTHVSRVRNKLELNQQSGWRLGSVYLYGYRLERVSPPAAEA